MYSIKFSFSFEQQKFVSPQVTPWVIKQILKNFKILSILKNSKNQFFNNCIIEEEKQDEHGVICPVYVRYSR